MKKSEELEKLCPPPKPSEIAGLSLTATTAMVSGRYINGQVMTVAMWDGKKKSAYCVAVLRRLLDRRSPQQGNVLARVENRERVQ